MNEQIHRPRDEFEAKLCQIVIEAHLAEWRGKRHIGSAGIDHGPDPDGFWTFHVYEPETTRPFNIMTEMDRPMVEGTIGIADDNGRPRIVWWLRASPHLPFGQTQSNDACFPPVIEWVR